MNRLSQSTYFSRGKLLLTGEYLVLDGAVALAIPTRLGQSLKVKKCNPERIHWKSFDYKNELWFQVVLSNDLAVQTTSDQAIAQRLVKILGFARKLNPKVDFSSYEINSHLEFPRDWGLGSSSTLLNNLATWIGVDPYQLLLGTFGGSGYDIACAQQETAITYQLIRWNSNQMERKVTPVEFAPHFADKLFFVHLNNKQNSRKEVELYRKRVKVDSTEIKKISRITKKVLLSQSDLPSFLSLLEEHEQRLSKTLKLPTVQKMLFDDYPYVIKSLGAWGGDFVMTCGDESDKEYFKKKGYTTILSYEEIVYGLRSSEFLNGIVVKG